MFKIYRKPMIKIHSLASLGLLMLGILGAYAQSYIAAEDEAFYDAYNDAWSTGTWSGRGFGAWQLFAPEYATEGEEQYAGFFIADAAGESDLKQSACEGKAFGIFANGMGFEETVAFRSFERPLGQEMCFHYASSSMVFRIDSKAIQLRSLVLALLFDKTRMRAR